MNYNKFSAAEAPAAQAFGVIVADMDNGATRAFFKSSGEIVKSTGTGNPLDAKFNWWGHHLGPRGQPELIGRGVVTSQDMVVVPFLACNDDVFCEGNAACQQESSILDPQTSRCVANAAACHANN